MNLTREVAVQLPAEKYYFVKVVILYHSGNWCKLKMQIFQKSGLCGNKMSSLSFFFLWLYLSQCYIYYILFFYFFEGPDGHTVSWRSIYLGTAMTDKVYMGIMSPYIPPFLLLLLIFYYYYFLGVFCQSVCLFVLRVRGWGGRVAKTAEQYPTKF